MALANTLFVATATKPPETDTSVGGVADAV